MKADETSVSSNGPSDLRSADPPSSKRSQWWRAGGRKTKHEKQWVSSPAWKPMLTSEHLETCQPHITLWSKASPTSGARCSPMVGPMCTMRAVCTQFLINHYGTTPAWLPPGVLVTPNPTNTGVEAKKREVLSTTRPSIDRPVTVQTWSGTTTVSCPSPPTLDPTHE